MEETQRQVLAVQSNTVFLRFLDKVKPSVHQQAALQPVANKS